MEDVRKDGRYLVHFIDGQYLWCMSVNGLIFINGQQVLPLVVKNVLIDTYQPL